MKKAFNIPRNYALSIIFCLLFTMVMLGVNFNEFNIPYPVFIFLLIVCAMISVLSYAGYIYWKIRDWNKYIYNVIYNLMAFFLLGLLVSVIVGFTFLVILNKD